MGKEQSNLDGWTNAINKAHEIHQQDLHEWSESLPKPDYVWVDKDDEDDAHGVTVGFWCMIDGSGVLMARKLKNGDWCRSDAVTHDARLIEILYAVLKGHSLK